MNHQEWNMVGKKEEPVSKAIDFHLVHLSFHAKVGSKSLSSRNANPMIFVTNERLFTRESVLKNLIFCFSSQWPGAAKKLLWNSTFLDEEQLPWPYFANYINDWVIRVTGQSENDQVWKPCLQNLFTKCIYGSRYILCNRGNLRICIKTNGKARKTHRKCCSMFICWKQLVSWRRCDTTTRWNSFLAIFWSCTHFFTLFVLTTTL